MTSEMTATDRQKARQRARQRARALAIASAVRSQRNERGDTTRVLSKKARISASTLARIENPDTENPSSPSVDTLEAIAEALEVPLADLLGEPRALERREIGAWPDALVAVIEERSVPVSVLERAYLEECLGRDKAPQTAETGAATLASKFVQMNSGDINDPDFWRSGLEQLSSSLRWRIVEKLVDSGFYLDPHPDSLVGLDWYVDTLLVAGKAGGIQMLLERSYRAVLKQEKRIKRAEEAEKALAERFRAAAAGDGQHLEDGQEGEARGPVER